MEGDMCHRNKQSLVRGQNKGNVRILRGYFAQLEGN